MSIFGPVVSAEYVQDAVKEFLQQWTPTYIAEVGKIHGFPTGKPGPFRSWTRSAHEDKRPEDQLPACVVVIPDTDQIYGEGDGTYNVFWNVTVLVIASGRDDDSTQKLVNVYTAAARMAMLQHQSLGGFADSFTWTGEDYDALDFEDERTLQAGRIDGVIEVANAVDSRRGPITLPADPLDPPDDYGFVEEVHIETQGLPQ